MKDRLNSLGLALYADGLIQQYYLNPTGFDPTKYNCGHPEILFYRKPGKRYGSQLVVERPQVDKADKLKVWASVDKGALRCLRWKIQSAAGKRGWCEILSRIEVKTPKKFYLGLHYCRRGVYTSLLDGRKDAVYLAEIQVEPGIPGRIADILGSRRALGDVALELCRDFDGVAADDLGDSTLVADVIDAMKTIHPLVMFADDDNCQ
jgi:hypothetical protein